MDMYKIAEVYKIFSNDIQIVQDKEKLIIDPSLYIDRFCSKLEFGAKINDVRDTAIRLI